MGTPEPKRQLWCRACGTLSAIEDMEPVSSAPPDLSTMLSDKWLCKDEEACLKRYAARNRGDGVVFAVVILPAPIAWAGGHVPLFTANPRLAEKHACAYRACVVPMRVQTDYREV